MIRVAILAAVAAASLFAEPALEKPRVSRAAIQPLERSFDTRVAALQIENPLLLVGATRGVYLEGYGVVFTAEVNLVPISLTPFRPQLTRQQIDQLRTQKLARIPMLRQLMESALIDIGASLDSVPENEQVVIAVMIFTMNWENTADVPSQVMVQAPKSTLLAHKMGRVTAADLRKALQVREQ